MMIAEPTGEMLLEENRQRLLRELPAIINAFELRYELPSTGLAKALEDGRIADTEEVCEWVIAWEALSALGSPQLE